MDVTIGNDPLVNWQSYQQARTELGANFVRILGYFREDGIKSVDRIEDAMRAHNATAMVIPAHTLKGESRQFGADPLSDLAETIEMIARGCIERRETPTEALEHVVKLRPLFETTLDMLEREANPLVARKPVPAFGRRPVL
ncbi:Hpt domain-containing protein [Sphingomonas psychrotolerans]|uniref:Hpt domain-containing protein n=1 Tax=Sphingomonas psychrotolerans TaxID=1327635 RepID=A0ABU3N2E2_9SPHN|nr:Hpt domain-containing protein [Sphingomonas psychrotolerans]MDT8758647.1 Hpt domain-containing protein [Sphingomonas psychrotolerans]